MRATLTGVGVGLRHAFADALIAAPPPYVRFVEIHPENYVRRGGRTRAELDAAREKLPVVTHGLTLGVGNVEPFDATYLRALRDFLRRIEAPWHSEHLCFTAARGTHFHDLMPVPLTREAIAVAVARIRQLQDALELPIAIENVTYYALPGAQEMSEGQFLVEVLEQADCKLLLDVNNVYVNAVNHGTDPRDVFARVDPARVVQMHVAGHLVRKDGIRIDTHAEPVIDEVKTWLGWAAQRFPGVPVLLERDGNYPAWDELSKELASLDAVVREARGETLAPRDDAAHVTEPRVPELDGIEASLASICFDAEPRDGDLARVGGDAARWRLYRYMVRYRIADVAAEGLPRTAKALGKEKLDALVSAWLADAPPRARFFRDLVPELADWALAHLDRDGVPAWLGDLVRLESTRWETAHAETERPEAAHELDFGRVPLIDPGVRLLSLRHAVQDEFDATVGPEAREVHLCVHRRPDDHVVDVWTLNSVTARLLDGWRRGTETLAETTKRVLAEDGGAPTAEFIDGLATVLADLSARGVVIGSR